MGDGLGEFDGEAEVGRRGGGPAFPGFALVGAVEAGVDFYAMEMVGVALEVGEFGVAGWREEGGVVLGESPAGGADVEVGGEREGRRHTGAVTRVKENCEAQRERLSSRVELLAFRLRPRRVSNKEIVMKVRKSSRVDSMRLAVLVAALGCMCGGALAQGFRTEAIFDPALNMKAYDVTIPAGWKYQGVLMPGSSCNQNPSPVFRAYAQDGLTEFRRMPRFDWSWGNAPYNPRPKGDCLGLDHDVSAIHFAEHLSQLQKGSNFRQSPLSENFQRNFRQALDGDNAFTMAHGGVRAFRGDAAAARFEFANGTFVIEEQVRVSIRCTHSEQPGLYGKSYFHEDCGADVRVLRAPKGKLEALISLIESRQTGAMEDGRWLKAYLAVRQQQSSRMIGQIQADTRAMLAQGEEAGRVRQQQNQEYLAGQQGRYAEIQRQHDEMQGVYASHNAHEMANMDARHTPASDVVDFALDQQTVSGTGGTVKVPANYSQVWANQSGQYFLTNDLNTNPNGVLEGNWTPQTQVHGNGNPY